jgi:hypothetical protein
LDVEKKYQISAAKRSSLKEKAPVQVTENAPLYATRERMAEAVAHVMKVHGTALQKLAK